MNRAIAGLKENLCNILTCTTVNLHNDLEEVRELMRIYKSAEHSYINPGERKYLFIVYEGFDGSGKTALTKTTRLDLKGEKRETPPKCIIHLRSFFDQQNLPLKRAYYSLGNYIAALEIKCLLSHTHVVADRFWHSTAAYAIVAYDGAAEEGDYTWPKDLLKPDIVVYLNAAEGTRQRRMRNRKELSKDELRLKNDPDYRQRLFNTFKLMPELTIVNGNHTPQRILSTVKEKLGLTNNIIINT